MDKKSEKSENINISIEEKVKSSYIFTFCYWIFFLTILYYYNIIPFSLIYTVFGAVIFNLIRSILNYKKMHYSKIILPVFIETCVLLVNARKHFYIDHKKLFSVKDIIFNIVLFLLYLGFLYLHNLTFTKVYIEISKKVNNDPNEDIIKYLKNTYPNEFKEIKKRLDNSKEQHFLIEIPNKKRFDETIWNHLNKNLFINLFI